MVPIGIQWHTFCISHCESRTELIQNQTFKFRLEVSVKQPRWGTRWAELFEMPLMLIAIVLTSKWIVRRTHGIFSRRQFLAIGLIALALLVFAELSLVIWLRGISISEYIASRDPISGGVYLLMLIIFAAMPSSMRSFVN